MFAAVTATDGQMYVSDGYSIPHAVTMSGDATLSDTGVLTLKNTGPGATSATGSSNVVPILSIDAQGRVTSLTSTSITQPTSLTVGGDLYNTTANATVVKIQGQNFASGVPSVGQLK